MQVNVPTNASTRIRWPYSLGFMMSTRYTKTLATSIVIQHFVQAAYEGSVTGQSDSDEGAS